LTRSEHEGTEGHQGSATSPPTEKDRDNHKTRSGPTLKRAGFLFLARTLADRTSIRTSIATIGAKPRRPTRCRSRCP